ncbi:(d)CMP kinase [Coxiella endosymbiont of Ornithodoros amblus]|uniref:(d)CMP kinase n=1 Tax=Coxiella endosymbiont of Ornithodoros amblus TaxID=1656166 RepID=UPI00244E5A92|nr:(d)CMP kinase [Coxiella endosymbiont of Ornithodoros amblus]MBW5802573.1 (d)CMP kinase [Coxiella endosymbiont of Ornithodoros amblus]
MNARQKPAPVITIDGPSGSGKGTIALRVAQTLNWYLLDSGIIYRAVAWAMAHYKISLEDSAGLARLLKRVQISIENRILDKKAKISCDGHDITLAIRSEECGVLASRTSALSIVREVVLQYQRDFRQRPGLVADGRDMGTVVFPDAVLKFYFDADSQQRAYRRFKELQDRGINVRLPDIQEDLEGRDRRDVTRSISPTKPAEDAVIIDTTHLSIEAVFATVMKHVRQRGLANVTNEK